MVHAATACALPNQQTNGPNNQVPQLTDNMFIASDGTGLHLIIDFQAAGRKRSY
tara:strand:- start:148 stop:309 length:162 start_codon:yes stop_codon:yes gene_type:complete